MAMDLAGVLQMADHLADHTSCPDYGPWPALKNEPEHLTVQSRTVHSFEFLILPIH
jgi:hypothetical protein